MEDFSFSRATKSKACKAREQGQQSDSRNHPQKSFEEEMKDWNWNLTNHKEVFGQILSRGFENDILLILGSQKEEVKAHRAILSGFSPVLRVAIMIGNGGRVVLPEIDPVCFQFVLKYIYTGESGATIVDALPLLDMANRFKIVGLIEECNKLLEGNITMENAIPVFQQAMKTVEPDLIVSSLDYICEHGSEFLKSKDFLNLRLECIVEIVKQDGLRVDKEVEVFEAVCRWGEAEAIRQKLDLVAPDTQRKVLEKVLKYIRFPVMSQLEFSLAVASNKDLLPIDKILSLFVYFSIPKDKRDNLPERDFITTPRSYGNQVANKELFTAHRAGQYETWYSLVPYDELTGLKNVQGVSEMLSLKASEPIYLHGIKIVKGLHGENPENWDYSYKNTKINVNFVVEDDSIDTNDEYYSFADIVPRGDEHETMYDTKVIFPRPCKLDKNTWARLKFTAFGSYNVQAKDGFGKFTVDYDKIEGRNIAEDFVTENKYQFGGKDVEFQFRDLIGFGYGFIGQLIFSFQ